MGVNKYVFLICKTETVEEPIEEDAAEPEKEASEDEAEVEEEDEDKDKPKTKKVVFNVVVNLKHYFVSSYNSILIAANWWSGGAEVRQGVCDRRVAGQLHGLTSKCGWKR